MLNRHQPLTHHFIQPREERLDLFFSVNDLDDDRKIFGEAKDLRSVDSGVVTVTHDPANYRGASQMELTRLEHDRLVEGTAVVLVALAEKHPEQNFVFVRWHHVTSPYGH